jgi:hypothetical protein
MPAPATFSPDHLQALVEASRRTTKIRRCVTVATFGGWTTGAFGGITLLGAIVSFSFASLFIGVALLAAAWGEFHGAAMVRRYEPAGARRLAMNQVMLGAALFVYAVWSLISGLRGGGVSSGNPQVDEMIGSITRAATIMMYGVLAVVGLVGPGLTALYYSGREKLIRQFRDSTEPSVIEALKAA